MKPVRLYIHNFMCYEHGFIDFTEFSSALIIGKQENNDMYSNGVGKTTIFKSIEYVLFNQSDVPLERVIRDDTNSCQVVLDFMIGDQEYRLSRSRTKKGSTDLTLLLRNSAPGLFEEVYHSTSTSPWIDKKYTEKFWKDISGDRASDTEKDLAKLIKTNHKSFSSTVLFPQKDITGLATATPEKRKGILKEAFNLLIYAKLEKIAKDRAALISKELDKSKAVFDSLGDPSQDLLDLDTQLVRVDKELLDKNSSLIIHNDELSAYKEKINELTNIHNGLSDKFAALLVREKSVSAEKARSEISVKEYSSKKTNAAKTAKELIEEIKSLKNDQMSLAQIDFSQIDVLGEKIVSLKDLITEHNVNTKNSIEKYEDLKIPLPSGSVCKNCRKPMTDQERKEHKEHITKDMLDLQKQIQLSKQNVVSLNAEISGYQQIINSLNLSKQQLENINTRISTKDKEVQDKKELFAEYTTLHQKFVSEVGEKSKDLESLQEELKLSSINEANLIKDQIQIENEKTNIISNKILSLNKELFHYNSNKAVLEHSIDQKKKDKLKKEELQKNLIEIDEKLSMFPLVIQAFSTIGIPNLIIQNVLDDLQIESNNLLAQLKPGLQLSFSIEKTVNKTGDQADTLDINYIIKGKNRYFEQLSGAQQLAVSFSLKLGLSFLLQKMTGADIKFLLLDEIDQSLDKASVDAFVDIVKFFQKDFIILIITHNDRLKDKFSHAILVEQDINMISTASVVSSW